MEQLHQLESEKYIHNVQQELLLVEEEIDKNVDIHYQECVGLDYAKTNVIDCKPMEVEILEELLTTNLMSKNVNKICFFTEIICLIC